MIKPSTSPRQPRHPPSVGELPPLVDEPLSEKELKLDDVLESSMDAAWNIHLS
jgi:hypothetical protein